MHIWLIHVPYDQYTYQKNNKFFIKLTCNQLGFTKLNLDNKLNIPKKQLEEVNIKRLQNQGLRKEQKTTKQLTEAGLQPINKK